MDRVNWIVALQHRVHSRESNYGSAVQVVKRPENVQTVSEYAINSFPRREPRDAAFPRYSLHV